MTNCPNCGAPIRGPECEYCGTVFQTKPIATPLYDVFGDHILTLMTPNEARELMGLPRIEEENFYE